MSVMYPKHLGPAPTVIDLAALYDRSAARVARLELALRACVAPTAAAAEMKRAALLPEEEKQ